MTKQSRRKFSAAFKSKVALEAVKNERIVLILILTLLSIRCSDIINREKVVSFKEFKNQISVSGKSCSEIKDDIYPMFMGIKDSILVLCDIQSDPHVYVYSLPYLKFLGSFGSQGKGPVDLLDPVFWGQFENNPHSQKAWFYQPNAMRYSLIDIQKATSGKDYTEFDKQIILPPHIGTAVNIILLDENTIVASGRVSEGEFMIYNTSTKRTEWKPFLIDFDKQFMDDIKKAKMFNSYKQGIIKAKPDGTRFVKAFGYIPVIDVYNNKAELIFSIIQDSYRKPDINAKNKQFEPETRVYYTNVFLSDKCIYALNQNCTLQELSEGSCTDVEIHMFSWTGDPLYKIILNESIGSLAPFAVDELNNSIYVVNPKSQDDYLSVFDIGDMEYYANPD